MKEKEKWLKIIWKLFENWSFENYLKIEVLKIKFGNWSFENWGFENYLKVGALKII